MRQSGQMLNYFGMHGELLLQCVSVGKSKVAKIKARCDHAAYQCVAFIFRSCKGGTEPALPGNDSLYNLPFAGRKAKRKAGWLTIYRKKMNRERIACMEKPQFVRMNPVQP